MRVYDTVVIGAGPAGLSAAAELSDRDCLVVEHGPPAGDRDRDGDVLCGVGGAGLFSDGKHSFYPSATALWQLPSADTAARAFEATAAFLADYGVDAGALPPRAAAAPVAPGAWHPKHYRSVYVSLADRHRMIDALWRSGAERRAGARVVGARRTGDRVELDLEGDTGPERVAAASLVVATGRLSPGSVRPWLEGELGARYAFVRAEVGARLEAASSAPLFAHLPGVDGKLRYVEPGGAIELRTFCTCRDGEVVLAEAFGVRAYSGRADGPPTGRSNVGLVVRTSDPELGRALVEAARRAEPVTFELAEWRAHGSARVRGVFGARGAELLTAALARLDAYCPEWASATASVHAPAVEGVGEYPVIDGELRAAPGVWIAGDACGRFRGIVAAMVSGRYAARRIIAGTR